MGIPPALLPSCPPPTSNPPKPTHTPTVPYFSIIVAAHSCPSHSFLISMRPQPTHTPKTPMHSYSLCYSWPRNSLKPLYLKPNYHQPPTQGERVRDAC